jgi:hypothetical protein
VSIIVWRVKVGANDGEIFKPRIVQFDAEALMPVRGGRGERGQRRWRHHKRFRFTAA